MVRRGYAMGECQRDYTDAIAVTEDHLEFLDGLRESGITNMVDAVGSLQEAFPELSRQGAKTIVVFWLETFAERHPKEEAS
jgi:hypothetical protein